MPYSSSKDISELLISINSKLALWFLDCKKSTSLLQRGQPPSKKIVSLTEFIRKSEYLQKPLTKASNTIFVVQCK